MPKIIRFGRGVYKIQAKICTRFTFWTSWYSNAGSRNLIAAMRATCNAFSRENSVEVLRLKTWTAFSCFKILSV